VAGEAIQALRRSMNGRRLLAFFQENRLAVAVFAVAFLMRLAYLLAYARSPFFQVHIADALFHEQWAERIRGGDIFSLRMPGVLYKAPLYPYFLAASFGLSGGSSFFAMLLQVGLSAASCLLLFAIGQRYFGRWSALVGAALYCLYFPSIYFSAEMEIPALAIFLTLFAYYLLMEKRGPLAQVASAITFGLSLLALPSNLLLLPLYGFLAYTRAGEARRIRRTVLFAALVFATVAPCTIRNLVAGHRLTLVSANGGINFFIGNNEHYDQTVSLQPGYAFEDFYDEPRRVAGASSFSDRDRYWYRKAIHFVREHPGKEASLLLKKLVLYFASYEIYRNTDLNYAKAQSIYRNVPLVPAALLLAGGLVGLGLAMRRREGRELAALCALMALPCILFFVTDRYRLPSMAGWALFAGLFVTSTVNAVRSKAWRFAIPALALALTVGGLSSLDLFVVKNPAYRPHFDLGFIYETQAKLGQALQEYGVALKLLEKQTPRDLQTESEINARIGNVRMTENDLQAARSSFERALALNPASVAAYSYLGTLYGKQKQTERALQMFNKALALNPWDVVSLHNLALLYLDNDQIEEAIAKLRSVLELAPEHAGAHSDLAYAYAKQGKNDSAESESMRALFYDPGKVAARYNLAALYLASGRIDEATAQYRTITQIAPRDASNAYNQLGVLDAQKGDLPQAMVNWEKAVEADASNMSARANLQRARLMMP
jgi:Tfp pilus assembly protein PilF/4-amino-4-deoxy-L-arabinose transferase-like glycosyltransferase